MAKKVLHHHYTADELQEKIRKLKEFCSEDLPDTAVIEEKRDKGLHILTDILLGVSESKLRLQNQRDLIVCAMRILIQFAHYKNRLRNQKEIPENKRMRKYIATRENLYKLLKIFAFEKTDELVSLVIDIIHSEKIWPMRRLCTDIFKGLLEGGCSGYKICSRICDIVNFPDSSNTLYKSMVKVLYEFLEIYKWPVTKETKKFLVRLSDLYFESLHDIDMMSPKAYFTNLRASFELCIRHMIPNISHNHVLVMIEHMSAWSIRPGIQLDVILRYGSTLEYAAYVHKGDSLANTLTSKILLILMQMIGSECRFVSLLGNRILQFLIDGGDNLMLFNTPKIFFQDIQLNITLCKYHREDKKFLKQNRKAIHNNLMKSMITHRHNRSNLETTYCTICLLAIEIPCGFTAAVLCCLMMHLQEVVRKHHEEIGRTESYHIHAVIISVLSFVCWINEAKDFHNYINSIIMERAQWAPHLNPPIQTKYHFAMHHVLWYKHELYLIDWEVRYGLWKRFRLDKDSKILQKRVKILL